MDLSVIDTDEPIDDGFPDSTNNPILFCVDFRGCGYIISGAESLYERDMLERSNDMEDNGIPIPKEPGVYKANLNFFICKPDYFINESDIDYSLKDITKINIE